MRRQLGFGVALMLGASLVAGAAAASSRPDRAGECPQAFENGQEKGSCSWYCDDVAYRTAAACDVACAAPCEPLCW